MAIYRKNHKRARKEKEAFSSRDNECDTIITKTGCQWRMLPKDFAPWQTVYYYFRRLTIDYEFLADTTETMVQLAFSVIMLNKFFQ